MNNKHLYLLLKKRVKKWRESGYRCSYPTIAEILEYSITSSANEKSLRFLRSAQLEALETYWYLRLAEKTPCVFDLYKKFYSNQIELLKAMGVPTEGEEILSLALSEGIDGIIEKIKTDDKFCQYYYALLNYNKLW